MLDTTPAAPNLPALDTLLFDSPTLKVGRFEVGPDDPRFTDSGPIERFPVVFPVHPVWIHRRRSEPILTDRKMVLFYNREQRYTRSIASPAGDRCHWFSFVPAVLSDVVGEVDPEAEPLQPFRHSESPCGSDVYLTHHILIRHLQRRDAVEPLFVEEAFLGLLRRILHDRYLPAARRHHGPTWPAQHEELVQRTLALLAIRFREPLDLAEVAAEVGASPFHLCRVFRKKTGTTVHAHRLQLRLRTSLEAVAETREDLTEIALDAGFSSHSHFTAAFRKYFGRTPSSVRAEATQALVRVLLAEMQESLTAARAS